MAVTTSIRMPDDVHEQYELLANATGRTRNDLMVEALRGMAERRLHEIAMIQEGIEQSRAGLMTPIADVVEQFKSEGILAADFKLHEDTAPERA